MKKLLFLFICGCCLVAPAYAQVGARISGRVTQAAGKALDGATIVLQRAADSSLVKTALSDLDGGFSFDKLADGTYRLRIGMIGFANYTSDVMTLDADHREIVSAIALTPVTNQLNEVAVTAQKPLVEKKIDRTVVNVDAMISNAGTTALDVLEKSPGIQVDQNGAITLKGKSGVTVFVDDKPTYLSGDALVNYLRSLPSGTLDQVEIMTNPPARYDAAGGGGVINIRTKHTRIKGFNGSASLSYLQGHLPKSNNTFNFNYRANKLNVFGNAGAGYYSNFTDLDIIRNFSNPDLTPRSELDQNSYIRRRNKPLSLKLGADLYASEKTTWGVVLSGQYTGARTDRRVTNNLLGATRALDSVIAADNHERSSFKNGSAAVNFRRQYDKNGHELTAEADYVAYRTDLGQDNHNSSYYANGGLKSQDVLTGDLPLKIRIVAARTDYTKPLKKGGRFEAGLKSSYTKTDNLAEYANTVNGITTPDYDKSNHFRYNEGINAAYLNFAAEGTHFSLQTGLRLENTVSDGYQSGNPAKRDSAFRRTYTNLFPTFFVSYKDGKDAKHVFNLNYGKRVSRPYYQDLNPFISPLDKFTYYVGNPFLKPAFTHGINLEYTYHTRLTLAYSWSFEKDGVNETIEIKDGIYYSRPGNIGRKTVTGPSIDAALDPAKWLRFHVYSEVTTIHSKGPFYSGTLDSKGTYWFVQPNAQLTFSKTWSGELNATRQSKSVNAQFTILPLTTVGGAIQKKLGAASTLRLTVADALYQRQVHGVINNLYLTKANWVNRSDSRTVALIYSWRFGKAVTGNKKYENKGAQEEQGRVKN